jgi:hypothetical protein
VKYSLACKIFFVSMLVLTLPLKAIVLDTSKAHNHVTLQDTVIAFLARHQFETHGAPADISIEPIVAISGDCRLEIREMIPQGWNRDRINLTGADGQLFFVFKGVVYASLPTGIESPAFNHYWTRLKQKLGLEAKSSSILEVIASRDCSFDGLEWKDVAELAP